MHTPQLTHVEGTSGSGVIKLLNAECAITQKGYCCVFRKVHRCMLPCFDESESDALLARDWIGHSDGREYLTRVQFQDAVFQHADAWTMRGAAAPTGVTGQDVLPIELHSHGVWRQPGRRLP